MEDWKKIAKLARILAKEAGSYALKHMNRIGKISHKGNISNLVTKVDRRCEEIIISKINNIFPHHSVLAEEGGEQFSGNIVKWVIDPLDGTTNYIHGFPVFCVSIAVLSGEDIKLGVVYDPTRDELFFAERAKGAFLNNKKIRVSRRKSLKESLIATGFSYSSSVKAANIVYFEKVLKKAQAVRRAGSAAIDLCYVACGRFDGFWELGLAPWDTAAGELIVKEAGGDVTSMSGKQFDIFKKEVLATNSLIHREMISLLNLR